MRCGGGGCGSVRCSVQVTRGEGAWHLGEGCVYLLGESREMWMLVDKVR